MLLWCIAGGLLIVSLWVHWQPQPSLGPAGSTDSPASALPQHPLIRVYFNQARSGRYVDYRGLERPGDDLERRIVEELGRARTSVDIAIHELNLPGIALAIGECDRRGVAVRVILEHTYHRDFASVAFANRLKSADREAYDRWRQFVDANGDGRVDYGELQKRDAVGILKRAKIPVIDDTDGGTRGSGIMHHKFLIIDNRRVVTGSTNFTTSDVHGDPADPRTLGNVNHLIVIESAQVAGLFAAEFTWMWGDGPGGAPDSLFGRRKPVRPLQSVEVGEARIGVQFGPGEGEAGINALIARRVTKARRSLDFALFVFSAPEIAKAIQRAAGQGVRVRGALDSGFAYRDYSMGFDLWGMRPCASKQSPPIKTVGVALLPRGDKLHHKFALLDNGTVLTGSHNWSVAADRRNDESFLIIESPIVAAHFRREFERLYSRVLLGPPKRKPKTFTCTKEKAKPNHHNR
ncbi:phospholipase D-like domain-containing protein [Gloeobacter violaceus]|nr:phospholipase D-like domain-containing protein [Gloeobacter violaceus]